MATKKAILLKKYIEMTEVFKDMGLFPQPEDIDIVDFLFLVSHYFSPHYKTQDYEDAILECVNKLGATVSKHEIVYRYDEIKKYINYFVEFIKQQE